MAKSLAMMHILLMNMWPKSETSQTNQLSQGSVRKCYYCWAIGHFIADCQFLAADVAEGKIEVPDNGTKVDEKAFPKEPSHLSLKDRVDRLWKNCAQFYIKNLPEDAIIELVPWKQFSIEDPSLPEDRIINLMPECSEIVTLNWNVNVRDEKDGLISDLQEKTRHATEECDMWKAVTTTRQTNVSVPVTLQVPQTAPQLTMLASMMNLAMTNSQSVKNS